MFRAVPLPIIRISLTVHLALVYVIRFEDNSRAGPARELSSNWCVCWFYYEEICYDAARSHVTMHGHMSRVARSHERNKT